MNRTKSIVVFAGIFAIAMTTYGLSGISASPMIMALTPQTNEGVGMQLLGHVEHTVFDANGIVKAYAQSDNVVVRTGSDCTAELLFSATGITTCSQTSTFRYIAIGNQTGNTATEDDSELAKSGSGCAGGGPGDEGEMARKLVTPTAVDASGSGTVVTLDIGTDTFKFDSTNATTVEQSAIFNADITSTGSNGECGTLGTTGSTWEMFAIQDLEGGSGVTVSAGDSLAVKWTITIT